MIRTGAPMLGLAIACMGLLAGGASADMIGPKRPVNKGFPTFPTLPNVPNIPNRPQFNLIPVDHVFKTDLEFPEYAFFKVVNDKALEVSFGSKTPIQFRAALLPQQVTRLEVVAIPKEAKAKYKTEKELLSAVVNRRITGRIVLKGTYVHSTVVPATDPRQGIVIEHTVEKIDAKKGWVVSEKPRGCGEEEIEYDPAAADETVSPTSAAPMGRGWVTGLALTAGFVFAGLWLTRRETPMAKE